MNNKGFILPIVLVATAVIVGSIFAYDIIKTQPDEVLGDVRVLTVPQGGTGQSSFTAGECIVGNGTGALTSQSCSTGTGGGSNWLVNASGQLTPTSTISVLLPANATTTGSFSAGQLLIDNTPLNITNWDTAYSWGDWSGEGFVTDLSGFTTADLSENTNLYYTDARVQDYINASTTMQSHFTNADTAFSWGDWSGEGFLTSVATGDITDGTILEADLNASNSPTDNYLLSYNAGDSNFTWVESPSGSSPFTDAGTWIYPTDGEGLVVTASSTFIGDFRMDGNATSTGHIASVEFIQNGSSLASLYQPLEATLTDIADGTIAEDLVNTAYPWADNEVSDSLTVTGYMQDEDINTILELNTWVTDATLLISGGTLTNGYLCVADGTDGAIDCNVASTYYVQDGCTDCLNAGEIEDIYLLVAGDTSSNNFTWTGVHDFGGGVIEITNGAAPTVDAAGEIAIDTTSDQLVFYGGAKRVIPYWGEKCFTIASTTWASVKTNIPLWHPKKAVTITDVYCETEAGTSVAIVFGDGTNSLESITCDDDGAADDGSIANGTFVADEKFELDIGAIVGAVDYLNACITYDITAD